MAVRLGCLDVFAERMYVGFSSLGSHAESPVAGWELALCNELGWPASHDGKVQPSDPART